MRLNPILPYPPPFERWVKTVFAGVFGARV